MMVYAILKGWYSDRHIVGIVESEKEAKELCKMFNKETRYDSDSVSYEEYDTKKFSDKRFRFIVNDYAGLGDWECEYDDYDLYKNYKDTTSLGSSGFIVYAESPQQAIKIAQDMRAMELAEKEGIV